MPFPTRRTRFPARSSSPQKQVNRNSDIYVSLVSHTHQVAAKGWFIAMVSTTVETDNPEAEIKPGLDLLGPVAQKFVSVSDVYRPTDLGADSQVMITFGSYISFFYCTKPNGRCCLVHSCHGEVFFERH
ncbi:hypothetical protein MRX96_018778 [Rhipicephalus microplus]